MISKFDECCQGFDLLNFAKMDFDLFWWTCHKPRIDWSASNLYYCIACIIFNPLFWNCAARLEYNYKVISSLCGSPKKGATFLGATIFFLALIRGRRYQLALEGQYTWPLIETDVVWVLGTVLLGLGLLLVVTSFFALGFFGTYLGDYFGILMEERVTSFPFNFINDPMYWGSVLEHLGVALRRASPTGLFLTGIVSVVYVIAILVEGPFTAKIYAQKAAQEKEEESKKNK